MKTFFDGIFIDGSEPDEQIEYPIKLEYYKTIETEENVEAKYGVEIVITEFINGKINVESKMIENVSSNEFEVDKFLTILRDNQVTPIGIQDALDETFVQL